MNTLSTRKCLLVIAITASFSQQVIAQENIDVGPQTNTTLAKKVAKTKEKVEKIVITGSRLRRDSFSVPTPLVVMTREDIADTGVGSLADILVDGIPSLTEDISNTNSQSLVSGTGLSTVNLRGLGASRTLTLIDGRRVVSNSYSGNKVSLSTIPSGMVQRVEVITGGASATYGADAVSGVVNIITQTDKEGFSLSGRTGESFEGGAKEFTIDMDYGTSFDDDKGYVFVSSSWDREFGLSYSDRKRAQLEDVHGYDSSLMCNTMQNADGDDVCMRDQTPADWASKSDGTLGGVFLESSNNDTQFWYDGQTLRDDWKGNEERYGINSNEYVALKIPNDKFSTAVKLNYDINDSLTAYAQVQLSLTSSFNNKSPEDDYESAYVPTFDAETGDALDDIRPGYIPIDNPYVPQEMIDTNPYKDRIYWDRRFGEVGNITTENNRTTLRTWAGLQGTAFNDEWEWDMSVGFGKFHQEQHRNNELNIVKVNQALQAEQLEDGTIQCKDEQARADGCVALNIFGEGSITPEMADWIRSSPTINTYIEQYNLLGYMTGDLFKLPAGNVSAVFGGEYRKDTVDLQTSEELKVGGITWNTIPEFNESMDVFEIFSEFSIPLLREVTFAKSLSVETSLRLAQYSVDSLDNVASYKLGFMWIPVEGYGIRANYSRSQRAPSISDLYSPPRGDFDSFDDICEGVTATSTEVGHANCRLDPTLATLISEDEAFELADENNSYSPNAGNSNVNVETSDSYTFGITMAPDFLTGFNLAIDYYDISIEDALGEIPNEEILEQCYNSSLSYGTDNAFCNDITRNSEGQITKIIQRVYNLNEESARGVDITFSQKIDLNDYGSLTLKGDFNHVIEQSTTYEGNDGLETLNYAGYYTSQDKGSVSLRWKLDELSVRWKVKYLGGFKDELETDEDVSDYLDAVADNKVLCNTGDSGCIENPEPLYFQNYGTYLRHDISASYSMKMDKNSRLKISGGINNIFDNNGLFHKSTGNYYSGYGGGVGRFGFIKAEYSF